MPTSIFLLALAAGTPSPSTPVPCAPSANALEEASRAALGGLLTTPGLTAFTNREGRGARVRITEVTNRTRFHLDIQAFHDALARALTDSGHLTVLPDRGNAVADLLAILSLTSTTEIAGSGPATDVHAMLQLVSPRTAQVVWLGQWSIVRCPRSGEPSCSLTGGILRALAEHTLEPVGNAPGVRTRMQDAPAASSAFGPRHLTVRLAMVFDRTSESLDIASPVQLALFGANGLTLLADTHLLDEGASTENRETDEETTSTAWAADLVATVALNSIEDETETDLIVSYQLTIDLVDTETAEKVWIGVQSEKLVCPL